MSFMASECLDLAAGSVRKAQGTVLAPSIEQQAGAQCRAARIGSTAKARWKARRSTRLQAGPDPAGTAARGARRRAGRRSASPLLCVGALVGYFAFPTYPTYDSFYALLWGRDLLHLHLPDFNVYRGPTEHPLAIAFGVVLLDLRAGRRAADGARLDRLLRGRSSPASTGSGACASARSSGCVAALLLLSRFFVENLAAQGYLDISYVALIVWAIVLEVERPRRGAPRVPAARGRRAAAPRRVGAERRLLAVVRWPAPSHGRSEPRALPRASPAHRAASIGSASTRSSPATRSYSLTAPPASPQELERTQGFSSVLGSVWTFAVRIDKLPVVLGGARSACRWRLARAAARARAAGGARCCCSACSSPRAPPARR